MTLQPYYTLEQDQIQTARVFTNITLGNIIFKFYKTVRNAPFYKQHLSALATLLHKIDDSSTSPTIKILELFYKSLTLGFITDCNLYILRCKSVIRFQSFRYSLLITLQNTSCKIIYLSLILIIAKLKTLRNSSIFERSTCL